MDNYSFDVCPWSATWPKIIARRATNKHRGKYSVFEDEEESDDPGTQNTLGTESGHEIIVGIDSQNAVATDNETTESGKAATKDVSNKSNHESATTNKSDAAGNKKRARDDNLEVDKGKKAKKVLERDNDGVKYYLLEKGRETYS